MVILFNYLSLSAKQLSENYFNELLKEMGGSYDPEIIGVKNNPYIDPSYWPQSIQKKVMKFCIQSGHGIDSQILPLFIWRLYKIRGNRTVLIKVDIQCIQENQSRSIKK